MFDGRKQGDGPDHQRKRTDDEGLIDVPQPAVSGDDRFHDIHGGRADVTVDDPDRDEEHAEADFTIAFLFHIS